MRIDKLPTTLWQVHINNRFDSQWSSRDAARQRMRELRNTNTIRPTLTKIPVILGTAERQ